MLHTTLNRLKEASACTSRYKVLCKALGGAKKYGYDSPIPIAFIVESNGLDDALWALRAVSDKKLQDKITRLFAVGCGYRVLPNFEKLFPNDFRVRMCLESSCLYAFGELTGQELSAAESAAESAARSAAWYAARSAAWYAARSAAESAARSAAWYAAWSAAWYAARSAAESAARSAAESAAESAAWYAARSAAWYAEEMWQKQFLIELLNPNHPIHKEA